MSEDWTKAQIDGEEELAFFPEDPGPSLVLVGDTEGDEPETRDGEEEIVFSLVFPSGDDWVVG